MCVAVALSPSAPPPLVTYDAHTKSPTDSTSLLASSSSHTSEHIGTLPSQFPTSGVDSANALPYNGKHGAATPLSNPESGRVSPADDVQTELAQKVFNFSSNVNSNATHRAISSVFVNPPNSPVNNPISPLMSDNSHIESKRSATTSHVETSPSITLRTPAKSTKPFPYTPRTTTSSYNALLTPHTSSFSSKFPSSSPVSPNTFARREEDMLHEELRQLEELGVSCVGLQKIAAALTPQRKHVSKKRRHNHHIALRTAQHDDTQLLLSSVDSQNTFTSSHTSLSINDHSSVSPPEGKRDEGILVSQYDDDASQMLCHEDPSSSLTTYDDDSPNAVDDSSPLLQTSTSSDDCGLCCK